jgi:GntR family transcriptional regulator
VTLELADVVLELLVENASVSRLQTSSSVFLAMDVNPSAAYYTLPMMIDKYDDSPEETGSDPSNSSVIFRLDSRSGVPTYLQLVQQVENAIRLGYLRQGDQLPRIKDVVVSLSINPNTVLKAYRDLEQKGLIGGHPGLGTFVKAAPETVGLAELTALRRKLVTGWLREAAATGLDEDGIVALFTSALGDFRNMPSEQLSTSRPRRETGGSA